MFLFTTYVDTLYYVSISGTYNIVINKFWWKKIPLTDLETATTWPRIVFIFLDKVWENFSVIKIIDREYVIYKYNTHFI